MMDEDDIDYNRDSIKVYGKIILVGLLTSMVVVFVTRTIDLLRISHGARKRVIDFLGNCRCATKKL